MIERAYWLSGLALLSGATATSLGGDAEQRYRVQTPDPGEWEWAGSAVVICDGQAVVFVPGDEPVEAAHIFDLADGTWRRQLIPDDPLLVGQLQDSMSAYESTVVVGAPTDSAEQRWAGSVVLFDVQTGFQVGAFKPDVPIINEWFGATVALSANWLAVTASTAYSSPSAVYVFDRESGTQVARLQPEGIDGDDHFGRALAIRDEVLLIGAPGDGTDDDRPGAVYVVDLSTLQVIDKWTLPGANHQDGFGFVLDTSDALVAVGVPGADDACPTDPSCDSGAVYLLDLESGSVVHRLLPHDIHLSQSFGIAVAIDGDTVLAGLNGDSERADRAGAAYLFDAETGEERAKFFADDPGDGHRFGGAVDLAAGVALLGAPGVDDHGPWTGAAYIFDIYPECAADLDCDRVVGFTDLVALLGMWGICAGCPEDLYADGIVSVVDLTILLAEWGPCP